MKIFDRRVLSPWIALSLLLAILFAGGPTCSFAETADALMQRAFAEEDSAGILDSIRQGGKIPQYVTYEGERVPTLVRVMDIPAFDADRIPLLNALIVAGADVNAASEEQGVGALHFAAFADYLAEGRLLLDKGADIEQLARRGTTPLMVASMMGNVAFAAELYRRGADLAAADDEGRTALQIAEEKEEDNIVAFLSNPQEYQDLRNNELWLALEGKDVAAAQTALALGADPDFYRPEKIHTILTLAIAQAKGEVTFLSLFDSLLRTYSARLDKPDAENITPLERAIESNQPFIVDRLLFWAERQGVQLIHNGRPLHAAITSGSQELLTMIAEKSSSLDLYVDGITPLMRAVRNANVEAIHYLLTAGADPTLLSDQGQTALQMAADNVDARLMLENPEEGWINFRLRTAAMTGELEELKQLQQQGTDLDRADEFGWRPLHYASRDGNLGVVNFLLENGADANAPAATEEGQTPLTLAAFNNNFLVANALLAGGADPLQKGVEGQLAVDLTELPLLRELLRSPENSARIAQTFALQEAVANGDLQAARASLEQWAAVNGKLPGDWVALHMASRDGAPEIVQLLLEHGAAVEAVTVEGWGALHLAAYNDHLQVCHLLLAAGADPRKQNGAGASALELARQGDHRLTLALLEQPDAFGRLAATNALASATMDGDLAGVKAALDSGAEASFPFKDNWQALHWAARDGYSEIVAELVKQAPDLNAFASTTEGHYTPLMLAAKNNQTEICRLLIEAGADLFAASPSGETALSNVGGEEGSSTANYLKDIAGEKANGLLVQAARDGDVRKLALALDHGADPNSWVPDNGSQYSPLQLAVGNKHLWVVRRLIQAGADVDSRHDDGQGTPLMIAAYGGQREMAQLLLASGADLSLTFSGNLSAIDFALDEGHETLAGDLRAYRDSAVLNGDIAWYLAAFFNDTQFLGASQTNSDPLVFTDAVGFNALHVAVREGALEIVERLLPLTSRLDAGGDSGWTPLMLAAFNNRVAICELLLAAGAERAIENGEGQTALDLARTRGHQAIEGLFVNDSSPGLSDQLAVAVRSGSVTTVQQRLSQGGDPNAPNSFGWAPLLFAARDGYAEIAELLINSGADVDVKTSDGWTPLMLAAYNGNLPASCLLYFSGSQPGAMNTSGKNALALARDGGHDKIVDFLENPWRSKNAYANHLLLQGAGRGDLELVRRAVALSADIGCQDSAERTPLHLAVDSGDAEIVEYLLTLGASVQVQDKYYLTAFEYAVRNGNLPLVKRLLLSSPNLQGYSYDSPLHLAAHFGYADIVAVLLQAGAPVEELDREKRTPLMLAVGNGNLAAARLLLNAGGNPQAIDAFGDSAVSLALRSKNPALVALVAGETTASGSATESPELVIQRGHPDSIEALAASPDGRYLVSGGWDNLRVVWDVTLQREITSFRGEAKAESLVFSPDGLRIASGDSNGGIELLDLQDPARNILLAGHDIAQDVDTLSFNADGSLLLSACRGDGSLKLWDASSGRLKRSFQSGYQSVNSALFSHHDNVVWVGTRQGRIFSLDPRSGKELDQLTSENGKSVETFALSPDGRVLAVVFSGRTLDDVALLTFDTVTKTKLAEIKLPYMADGAVTLSDFSTFKAVGLCFAGNNLLVTSAMHSAPFLVWDVRTGDQITQFSLPEGLSSVDYFMAYLAENRLAVSVDNKILLRTLGETDPVGALESHTAEIKGHCLDAEGRTLVVASGSGAIRTIDLSTSRVTDVFSGKRHVQDIVCREDLSTMITAHIGDLYKRDLARGEEPSSYESLTSDFPDRLALSPDGRWLSLAGTINYSGSLNDQVVPLYDLETSQLHGVFSGHADTVTTVAFTPDSRLLVSGGEDETWRLWDMDSQKMLRAINVGYEVRTLMALPDGDSLLTAGSDADLWSLETGEHLLRFERYAGLIREAVYDASTRILYCGAGDDIIAFNVETGEKLVTLSGHTDDVAELSLLPDRPVLVSSGEDGATRFWSLDDYSLLATYYLLDDDAWVVLDEKGRFDASEAAQSGMYYVVGRELIDLGQLKERFYEPGLLPKVLGANEEPLRNVDALQEVALCPEIELSAVDEAGRLVAQLKNRGGGIGRVVVAINGKEIMADARGEGFNTDAPSAEITVDISDHPYLVSGVENQVEVKAYNQEGYLISRGKMVSWKAPETTAAVPPRLFVIAAGVSDYQGDAIDLKFSAKDAEDIGLALQIGSERLFGVEQTKAYLYTSQAEEASLRPTKKNLVAAFKSISEQALSSDILVVYLSGHGINWGGQDGDFYYLTEDAYTANPAAYNDSAIRQSTTISSAELVDLVKSVPALKQVLIIDACASGGLVDDLNNRKDIATSSFRALDRLRDRTGMHVITGCAANAVSYEASRFGQGLLTYSILEGIKGAALREGRYVDVSQLFRAARDRVPQLAGDIGGIQEPAVFSQADTFDIGLIEQEDQDKIPLAQPKPMFLQTTFLDEETFDDGIGLELVVDDFLRDLSTRGYEAPLVFVDVRSFTSAYRIRGVYSLSGNAIEVNAALFLGAEKVASLSSAGALDNIAALAESIVTLARQAAQAHGETLH